MSWTVVYTSNQPHLIEIVKNILAENAIEFVTVDKRDSLYGSILGPAIEVFIKSKDYILGKKLILEFEGE